MESFQLLKERKRHQIYSIRTYHWRRIIIMERTKKAWVNLVFLLATLAVNALGAFGFINGLSQKDISDRYLTLITPSPSTFSIWSVIYTLLIISLIVMIVKKDDPYYQQAIDEITGLFRISCIMNIAWIILFSYLLIDVSTLLILGFAIALALICLKLLKIQTGRRFLLPLTFGLYTGWLFIASVANASAALVKMEWNGFGLPAETWAVIMIIVAVALVFVVLLRVKNAAFPLPIAWAFFGIYQFQNSPLGFKGQYKLVPMVALVGMVVLIGLAAIQLYRNKFSVIPQGAPLAPLRK